MKRRMSEFLKSEVYSFSGRDNVPYLEEFHHYNHPTVEFN